MENKTVTLNVKIKPNFYIRILLIKTVALFSLEKAYALYEDMAENMDKYIRLKFV